MYSRFLNPPINKSFFLFGPRGTGKTSWVRTAFPDAIYVNLLHAQTFNRLLINPSFLEQHIPPTFADYVIIDEVQKIPELLDEVHRLIEERKLKFILTGSSARKLKRSGVNLLAGRALRSTMYPLTAAEVGSDFDLKRALRYGQLPALYQEPDAKQFLHAYVQMYITEEVQQEGLTRNIGAFARFLEAASFSQGQILNTSQIARDAAVERKVVENYFGILEDLLLAWRLPVFTKRAKRKMTAHPKFYFFDVGVYRALRPKGPLDEPGIVTGVALESLILQEIRALNDYLKLEYQLYYWRTTEGAEVDIVMYGENDIKAIEVKSSTRVRSEDLKALKAFAQDYPMAKLYLFYGGDETYYDGKITIMPVNKALQNMQEWLAT